MLNRVSELSLLIFITSPHVCDLGLFSESTVLLAQKAQLLLQSLYSHILLLNQLLLVFPLLVFLHQ